MNSLSIQLAGHSFELFSGGGLYWPKHSALLVADLHLGKDATFRSFGIGVPPGSTPATLRSVSAMLDASGADELFVLGDLCHSRSSLSISTRDAFAAFQESHGDVAMHLVEGNHDRSTGRLPDDWKIADAGTGLHLDGVAMTHEPGPCPAGAELVIAGHLHPAYQLFQGRETTGKLSCFWHDDVRRCLILPACGHFTGTVRIRPSRRDRVWVIADDQVLAIECE